GYEHAARFLELGVRPLVATSGVSPEETRALDETARALGLGGLVVPNFSLGMWLLQRAAVEAALHFKSAAIVEMHHEKTKDAATWSSLRVPGWRNWETRWIQNPFPARESGFKSPPWHHLLDRGGTCDRCRSRARPCAGPRGS